MGHGSYTASDWAKLKNSRGISGTSNVDQLFRNKRMDDKYNPRFIEDHMLFGKAFFFAGDFVSAQREFDLVMKFEPRNAEALSMSAMNSLIRNKLAKFWNLWQLAVSSDSLYAVLPAMILKESFNFSQRERLKSHTQKMLELMSMSDIDRMRLNRLMESL